MAARTGRWAVLLRGVNVGGVRIRMAELAAGLADAGFTEVRTVLASGNVLVTSDADAPLIAERVADVLRSRFGHEIAVLVVPVDQVRRAVERYPFERTADRHAYVVLCGSDAVAEQLAAGAGALDPSVEQIRLDGDLVHWTVPKGATLESAFGRWTARFPASGATTTRNVNTLEKILAAA
jgi:uncharacterized protein (DUF1697 family)